MYIVVQVTLNRAEYTSQRSDQPENVNIEKKWDKKMDGNYVH